ncbi:MAG: hypothetical protein MZV64_09135, partial [Ignavibacteriales bacterium]|nr:hypothetical protein [Ignavibacteriales bacterium]
NLRKLYAVFLLSILIWLKNRIIEKYFSFISAIGLKDLAVIEIKMTFSDDYLESNPVLLIKAPTIISIHKFHCVFIR